MSDATFIPALVQIAGTPGSLDAAEAQAARKIKAFDGETYPSDGCAITLSCLLQDAGIDVPDTFQAIALGRVLMARGWKKLAPGEKLQPGDVGSTCGAVPNHGSDHIYLVLKPMNSDENLIADNQASYPHFRYASGLGGKTPTKFFLRAT